MVSGGRLLAPLLAPILVAASLVLFAGCSGESDSADTAPADGQSTAAESSTGEPADTPAARAGVERAIEDWWRTLRYRSPEAARKLLTPRVRRRLAPSFNDDVFQVFGPYAASRRLAIDAVRISGRDATAFVKLRFTGKGATAANDDLATFSLRRSGRRWLVADTRYFDYQVRTIKAAAEAAGSG